MTDRIERERDMQVDGERDRLRGKGNEAKGRVKRAAGDLAGDGELQAEGVGDQIKGNVQQGLGKVKQALDPDRDHR